MNDSRLHTPMFSPQLGMPPLTFLGPGSAMPAWIDHLERTVFGDPWETLGDRECLWSMDPLGYVQWSVLPMVNQAELLRIAVSPTSRGAGLGRRLLRESTRLLMAQGITLFHLEVRVSNHPARQLYESEGWTMKGFRPQYYRDGEDAALYGLVIAF